MVPVGTAIPYPQVQVDLAGRPNFQHFGHNWGDHYTKKGIL
jgi:hypothetical protein